MSLDPKAPPGSWLCVCGNTNWPVRNGEFAQMLQVTSTCTSINTRPAPPYCFVEISLSLLLCFTLADWLTVWTNSISWFPFLFPVYSVFQTVHCGTCIDSLQPEASVRFLSSFLSPFSPSVSTEFVVSTLCHLFLPIVRLSSTRCVADCNMHFVQCLPRYQHVFSLPPLTTVYKKNNDMSRHVQHMYSTCILA